MRNIKNIAIVGFFLFIGSCNLLFARTIPAQVAIQGRILSTKPFSPDGKKIVTGERGGKVYIHSSFDGAVLEVFNVNAIAAFWNRDGRSLVVSNRGPNNEVQTTLIHLSS